MIYYTITWNLIIGGARPPCWIIGGPLPGKALVCLSASLMAYNHKQIAKRNHSMYGSF